MSRRTAMPEPTSDAGGAAAVTVVMPLYNKRAFVVRAVQSVLAQTWREFELLVIDDGSTDGGGELVRELSDSRVRVVRTDNRGPGAARNLAVLESGAPWIALLDADDEWRPQFLEKTLAAARAAPATVAVYTDVVARDAVPPSRTLGSGPVEDYYLARMRHGVAMSCSSVMIQREALERCGGFREDYRYAEDIETWLRLSCAGPFYFVAEALSIIEVADQGRLSKSTDHLRRAAGLGTLYESFEALRRAGTIPAPRLDNARRFFEHQRGRQALHLALAGERAAALRLLAKVPLAAHTWRDHARVWRRVLLPASRGREPSTR